MSQITVNKKVAVSLGILSILLVSIAGYAGYTIKDKISDKETKKEVTTNQQTNNDEDSDVKLKKAKENIAERVDKKVEEIKKEDETKTVLTPEEIKEVEKKVEQKQELAYTNPYFPTLKLPYTSDWEFSTSTTTNPNNGLLSREVKFSKNNVDVKVKLWPFTIIDGGGGYGTIKVNQTTLANKLNKIEYKYNPAPGENQDEKVYITYGPTTNEVQNFGVISSNIPYSFAPFYEEFQKNSGLNVDNNYINFVYFINVDGDTTNSYFFDKSSNKDYDTEIDKLISGFQF